MIIIQILFFIFVVYCAFHLNEIHDYICDKLSKLEKRMYMSDASSVKKERALERTKERRHKRNQKNQLFEYFLTCRKK